MNNKKLGTVTLTVIRIDGTEYNKVVTYDEFVKLCRSE